jgi:hypothetical protein
MQIVMISTDFIHHFTTVRTIPPTTTSIALCPQAVLAYLCAERIDKILAVCQRVTTLVEADGIWLTVKQFSSAASSSF